MNGVVEKARSWFARNGWVIPLAAAAAATLLNASKPPMIDDTAYLAMARQVARAPADPYGFEQFWYDAPQPANHVLAPPVLPYWLAFGIRLFGENTTLLKFWLLPFVAAFALSLHALLRRWAPLVAAHAACAILFGPAFIPNLNFLLDIPAAALALAAGVAFLKCLEQHRWPFALFAGLLAGLAAQTKYTGALAWPMIALMALTYQVPGGPAGRRRFLYALVAVAAAVALFAAWELFVLRKYGESHFLFHVRGEAGGILQKLRRGAELPLLLGALLPPAAALVLIGWRWQRGFTLFCALITIGYLAIVFVPGSSRSSWIRLDDRQRIDIAAAVFAILGTISAATLLAAASRFVLRRVHGRYTLRRSWPGVFLAGWLFLELGGFFAMSPFPAARRVFGLCLVSTIIAARVLSLSKAPARSGLHWMAITPGLALGLLYNGLTICESQFEPTAVRALVAEIRKEDPNGRIWFIGHWGLQFEAERMGLRPVVPNSAGLPHGSRLEAGDWLIWPDRGYVTQQPVCREPILNQPVFGGDFRHPFPLRTVPSYYGGHLPMERWAHPHLIVRVYRLPSSWSPLAECPPKK